MTDIYVTVTEPTVENVLVTIGETSSGDSDGGPAHLTVAAYNSDPTIKARADYVCDGIADEVQINQATARGSKVQLSDGTFNLNSPVLVQRWGQEFCGSGTKYLGPAGELYYGSSPSEAGTLLYKAAGFVGDNIVSCENPSDNFILGRIHVHSFSVDGRSQSDITNGILFRAFQSSLHDVDVQYCGRDGIVPVGNETGTTWASYDSRIYSVRTAFNGRDGLCHRHSSAQDQHISQIIAHNNGRHGIGSYGGASHQIISPHCYTNAEWGIAFDNAAGSRTKVEGGKVEHNGLGGAGLLGTGGNPSQISLQGVNFSSNGESAHNTYDHIQVIGSPAYSLQVIGCTFATTDGTSNVARYILNAAAGLAPRLLFTNNTIVPGSYATGLVNYGGSGATLETAKIVNNINVPDYYGSPLPTAVAGLGAGGSAPTPVRLSGARTRRGSFTFGTGTSPASGVQVIVTFPTPALETNLKVMLNPRNASSANLDLYITSVSASGFSVSSRNTPTASLGSAVYGFDYAVIV